MPLLIPGRQVSRENMKVLQSQKNLLYVYFWSNYPDHSELFQKNEWERKTASGT